MIRLITMISAGALAAAIILRYSFNLFNDLLIDVLLILTILFFLIHLIDKYKK